ncbi:HD domain-containing protein [Oscillibacter sp.]|uniref:CCA tRNA nucleotidyltransferase n=1 Tax=Oscillibacter sp. TaxID=1945593 RepID=UPI0028A16E02|nr:HD domain-containing protein [Oscillibacter sp.]
MKRILKALEEHGHEAHCVGGCVRDSLLGREPGDWDVATSALPEETMALFPGRAAPTGLRHGTVTIREGTLSVEVTTFRTDGRYTDRRRPDSVAFTRSLRDDLSRRDFTVNAMGLDLRGTLTDPFGGREDLKNRLLRCVGSPEERFQEDALRILRCLRLAAVLGFDLEEETAQELRACRKLLRDVAAERIQVELTKLLCGPAAAEVLRKFPEVAGTVVPELLPMVGFDQHSRYHCYDVWEHTLHALSEVPAEPVLRWAVLLHDVAKPRCYTRDERGGHFYGHPTVSAEMADAILRRLKFDNATREAVITLVLWHDREIPRTEKSIRRALRKLGAARLRELTEVKRADNLGQAPAYRARLKDVEQIRRIMEDLLARDECVSMRQLAVNGRDMLALGLRGPEIGATLEELLSAVVDGDLPNQRSALLRAAEGRAVRQKEKEHQNF